jgi:hypothetical protein
VSERCKAMVATSLGRYSGYPCQKRAKSNGYCGNHDPEALERRIKNAHAGRVKERAEYLTALKLAAYRAGVEAAARIADNYSDCEQDSVDGSHRPNDSMIVRDEIRALPDPTPEQMEKIK